MAAESKAMCSTVFGHTEVVGGGGEGLMMERHEWGGDEREKVTCTCHGG